MKKLVFAAIAAMVMVSVSNVFASKKMASASIAAPVDTVAPADTTVTPSEPTAPTAVATPADTTDTTQTAE